MTTEQAQHQADLLIDLAHDDRENDGPYGPGETARVTAAANEALRKPIWMREPCWMCRIFGPERDCPCDREAE